jgi:galactitol-specific phosphotransferase system IIB component
MKIAYFSFIDPKNNILSLNATAKNIYFGSGGNTGNLVHINAYLDVLEKHQLTQCSLHDHRTIHQNDILLIACANQIGNHHILNKEISELIKKIKIPIIACCLGTQNNNMEKLDILEKKHLSNIDFFKNISDKRISNHPNISVRGHYSKDVLSFYGLSDTTVTGCISSMLFKKNIGAILKNKYLNHQINNVCIAGNNPLNGYDWVERPLMELVERYNGIHVVQSPEAMFALVNGENIDELKDKFEKAYGMSKDDIRRWFVRHGKFFTNTNNWLETMRLYDLVVGTRYHGVAIGIQAEIMGTILSIDSRTEELAQTSGIKYTPIKNCQNKNYQEILEASLWEYSDFTKLDIQTEFCKNQFDLFFTQNQIIL